MASTQPGSLSAAIERAARLLAVDPARAGREAAAILRAAPGDPRALLIMGSAHRRRGDHAAARALLAPLARAHPKAANTHFELGATLAALGEAGPAAAALRHAVSLNRELPEAWRALGDLLFREGDVAGAEAAFAEHARAAVTDAALRPAADALFEGRLGQAERLLRARIEAAPTDTTAMALLAEVFARARRYADAEVLLGRCLELDPNLDSARFSLASAQFHLQKATRAIAHTERLLARNPNDPAYRNLMAACLGLVGDFDRVIAINEALVAEFPRQPRVWLNHGHALRTVGRRQEAVDAYKRCIGLAPGLGDAYWSLANLKTEPFSAEEEASMKDQRQRPGLSNEDCVHLDFALGKAFEDRGDYAASFEAYARGAKLWRGDLDYDAQATSVKTRRTTALFARKFFADREGGGSRSDAPIFIVGLPRSGSTLIEQILASHSAVEGAMELPDIGFIAADLDRRPDHPYPDTLAELTADELTALGEAYIANTRVHRRQGRPHFIDKMPNNFQHLGLIHLILPRAKIIDARRHPMAACFSAFKQHFAQGQAFSYDLVDLGRYYRDYVELMAHFDEVLAGAVHRVIYEDLVDDTEGQIRGLLDHCGLPFEPACLRFYETRRAVRTVSSEQVRRPIFRDGVDRWRSYRPRLGPLEEALGPALETWRGVPNTRT